MHRGTKIAAVGSQFDPGQTDSTSETAPPTVAATVQWEHDDGQFIWQNLLDAQQEHLNTIFHANTRSVVEIYANEHGGNRFPWEILCATTIKEILGAESSRLAVEGDLATTFDAIY